MRERGFRTRRNDLIESMSGMLVSADRLEHIRVFGHLGKEACWPATEKKLARRDKLPRASKIHRLVASLRELVDVRATDDSQDGTGDVYIALGQVIFYLLPIRCQLPAPNHSVPLLCRTLLLQPVAVSSR